MEEKIRLAVFGQKRLSREGGIEIVVKELCTRMAQKEQLKHKTGEEIVDADIAQQMEKR